MLLLLLFRARKRLAHMLLQVLLILALAHGLMPYKYSRVKRKLVPTNCMKYYCLLINLVMLVTVCCSVPYELQALEVDFIRQKSLHVVLNALHRILSVVTLCATFVTNWTGRHELLQVFNEMAWLRRRQQAATAADAASSIDHYVNYVIVKSLVTFLQIVSSLYGKLAINAHPSSAYIVTVSLFCLTKNVLLLTGLNYCLGILGICQYLQELNAKLRCLLVALAMQQPNNNVELLYGRQLKAAAMLHLRLFRLAQRICVMYEWQVLMLVFSFFVGNIIASFYFLVYLCGKVVAHTQLSVVLFPQILLINIADFYLFICVCEALIEAAKECARLLRQFNDVSSPLSATVAQSVDAFALQCSSYAFHFRLCGALRLDMNMGFLVLVTTLTYLLFLVQFDYKNL